MRGKRSLLEASRKDENLYYLSPEPLLCGHLFGDYIFMANEKAGVLFIIVARSSKV